MIRVDHSKAKHALLAASASDRWMNCPGSVEAEKGQPDTVTDYAVEGTAAHALAEHCRKTGKPAAFYADEVITVTEKDGPHEVHVGEEMVGAVQAFLDEVNRALLSKNSVLYVEKKFDLRALAKQVLGVEYDLGGTTDCAVYQPRKQHLHVFDLKYGQGVVVAAENNPQLMTYALGALLEIEREGRKDINSITVTIVQPRAYSSDGTVRSWTISYEDLVAFGVELLEYAKAAMDPAAKRKPGSHCRFCKAAGTCPERSQQAQSVAMVEFSAMPVDLPPDPTKLTPAAVSHILDNLDILEDWIKAVYAHAQAAMERGEHIPGYKVVPKRANRRWKDEKAVAAWATRMGLGTDDYLTPREVKSVTQLEKTLKAEGAVLVLPEELYEKKSSGNTIAPDSDPRPAVALLTAGEEFAQAPIDNR